MPSLPLPSPSMYVIVHSQCRPHWYCHCHCLPTVCTWSCFQSADPLADVVTAFTFTQCVCDCACKVQTPWLMPSPPLPTHRMYVIVLVKCRPPLLMLSLPLPSHSLYVIVLAKCRPPTDLVVAFALFRQYVITIKCKVVGSSFFPSLSGSVGFYLHTDNTQLIKLWVFLLFQEVCNPANWACLLLIIF